MISSSLSTKCLASARNILAAALWVMLLACVRPGGAEAAEVQILLPSQEKVLYLPISGDSESIQKIRDKEIQAIERFFRTRGLAEIPVLTKAGAPEVYQLAEPVLAMEEQERRCKDVDQSISPAELVSLARGQLADGKKDQARSSLEQARRLLPCAEQQLTRRQLAELLMWSGLTEEDLTSEMAQANLRGALSADPMLVKNEMLPEDVLETLRKAAFDIENTIRPIDVHLPQGEGEIWSHKSLQLDGRRIVFDKLFVQLTPGFHYLRILLPNERTLGAFLEIKPASTPDLADLARQELGLYSLYMSQIKQVLATGYAGPALLQGLKLYAIKLKRDYFYFAALTEEEDGSWLTVRRYHIDRGIEVPEMDALDEPGGTASVPLALFQPWAVDFSVYFTGMTGNAADFRSSGGGVQLDAFYLLPRNLRVGTMLGVGGRSFLLLDTSGGHSLRADIDAQVGASLGISFPMGRVSLIPDLGYATHLMPLRGLPMYCGSPPDVSDTGEFVYDCSFSYAEEDESNLFNLRAMAGGPQLRIGLELKPFSKGNITLRGLLRFSYSPLFISIPERVTIDITTQDPAGNEESETAILAIGEDSRSWMIHQFGISVGIDGSY